MPNFGDYKGAERLRTIGNACALQKTIADYFLNFFFSQIGTLAFRENPFVAARIKPKIKDHVKKEIPLIFG